MSIMRCHRPALVTVASLFLGLCSTLGAEPSPAQVDQEVLQQAQVPLNAAGLLKFFRARTLTDRQRDHFLGLISRLGSDSFEVREKATEELIAAGELAAPLLIQAMKAPGADLELVSRGKRILESYQPIDSRVVMAAARQLALQKPAGAAETLLAYLPFAGNDSIGDAVRSALPDVAIVDGKPDAVLTQALEDKSPLRRGAAAEALVRAGPAQLRQDLRKFLQDPEPAVRLRVALGLADKKDREAIPVLIALLAELPSDQAWRAEEVLCRLAGEQTPAVSLGSDPDTRKKCRDAWKEWWTRHGATADLAKLDELPRMLGYTLLVQFAGGGMDRVMELGADGKPRWQIDNLQYAVDAQMLPNNRVLIVEYSARRVTERDLKGTVLWQKQLGNEGPFAAQRLTNGNTFIVSHSQMLEVDPDGKEVWTQNADNFRFLGAYKSRNGQITYLTSQGLCIRQDPSGKVLKSFESGHATHWTSGIDVLPSGRLLVPQHGANKVVEFDADGKQVWEATVSLPKAAVRLPNGHTLVSSYENQNVLELDRAGKTVWEHKDDFHQYRARRR